MALSPGLVSVTFRQLGPREIVDLVARARLDCIEWGGDIHVPHGDLVTARNVATMTVDAGLRVSAYGSYYRVWPIEPVPFEQVLETAVTLGAPIIRVWAGKIGSKEADARHWANMVEQSQLIGAMATQAGVSIAFEYHANTLTDTSETALRLVREINLPNVGSYWQPPVGLDEEQNAAGLKAILPWLRNLHVFAWQPGQDGKAERLPLSAQETTWKRYFAVASEQDHDVLLEFVRNDSPEAFLEDAATLLRLARTA